MFGRATITLGIGPHSSCFFLFFIDFCEVCYSLVFIHWTKLTARSVWRSLSCVSYCVDDWNFSHVTVQSFFSTFVSHYERSFVDPCRRGCVDEIPD